MATGAAEESSPEAEMGAGGQTESSCTLRMRSSTPSALTGYMLTYSAVFCTHVEHCRTDAIYIQNCL